MFWIVQADLFQQNERPLVVETLRRFGILHQIVEVARGTITPEVTYDGPLITNGSIMLSNIAIERGWRPGSLFGPAFSVEVWQPQFRDHLLNRDAVITTLAAADPEWDQVFIRPVRDDKSFAGRVITRAAFKAWQAEIIDRGGTLAETRILYAPVKRIGQEHRHFIVDGVVVSSSRYKLAGVANQSRVVDAAVIEFAARRAACWQPARAFVLDTYQTGDEIGIVEIGGICHAGFYQADVQKIIMALDSMD
jgi:hypothetical protein